MLWILVVGILSLKRYAWTQKLDNDTAMQNAYVRRNTFRFFSMNRKVFEAEGHVCGRSEARSTSEEYCRDPMQIYHGYCAHLGCVHGERGGRSVGYENSEQVYFAIFLWWFILQRQMFPLCHEKKYTFSPAELSSERGEKEVLADSTQLGGGAAINAVACELLRSACLPGREKMAPEGTSSTTGRALLQSMLVSADDSCHCPHRPTPLLLCPLPMVCLSVSPSLSLSLALSLSRCYAFKNAIVFNVHNMLPILGEQ